MEKFDDDIDFNSLQKELGVAIQKDANYQCQNDAKFRAINQKVASYEEFRNIVEASHLQCLDKKDKVGGMTYQKWNFLCKNDKTKKVYKDDQSNQSYKSLNLSPNSYLEFIENWRMIGDSNSEKFSYISSIGMNNLSKCLHIECPINDILKTFDVSVDNVNKNAKKMIMILEVMQKTKRFSLQIAFLEEDIKLHLQILFKRLLDFSDVDKDSGLLQTIHDLQKLYMDV